MALVFPQEIWGEIWYLITRTARLVQVMFSNSNFDESFMPGVDDFDFSGT